MMLPLYTRPRLVVTCFLCLIFSTSLCLAGNEPQQGVSSTLAPKVTTQAQPSDITESEQTNLAQAVSTTADAETPPAEETTKHNQSTESGDEQPTTSSPDAPAVPQVPTSTPAMPSKPAERPATHKVRPTQQVTTHTTQKPKEEPTKAQATTMPAKRNPPSPTTAKETTEALPVPTTPLQTTIQPLTTEAPVTTRITTEPTTQAPTTAAPKTKPPVTESKAPVKPVTSKPVTRQSSPARPPQTSRTPTTAQPSETEANQPEHEDHEPTPKPSSESNRNDTGWFGTLSHNSIFSKLMVPVVLGIVAAVIIVCFAYGIKACRKRKSSRGRHKLIQNGKDHELGGNFDRMKLLADSSEDEF